MTGLLASIRDWFARAVSAMAPQRADFEAANRELIGLVGLLRQRIADMDAEFQAYRKYTQERIRDLEAEAAECRERAEKDSAVIVALKGDVRQLRIEVAELKAAKGV